MKDRLIAHHLHMAMDCDKSAAAWEIERGYKFMSRDEELERAKQFRDIAQFHRDAADYLSKLP